MELRRIVLPVVLCALAGLAGCGGRQAVVEAEPAETLVAIDSIVLVPVAAPERLHTDNRSIPVLGALTMGIANTIADKGKSAGFEDQYGDYRQQAGEKLTNAIMDELRAAGYAVRLAKEAEVARTEKGVLDYRKFTPGSFVLDLSYESMGMYSGRTTRDYIPQIGAYINLVSVRNDQDLYNELYNQYYLLGGWADEDGNGYLLADPKYAFPTFGTLMEQGDLVRESYDHGIAKLAKFMVKDLGAQFKPAVVARPAEPKAAPAVSANKPEARTAKKKKAKRVKSSVQPATKPAATANAG